ncbi:MAG TPA: cytochrome c oxidase assembly protein [Longimicrobiales bacterium]|nr:cytochrome c oxidase assembly protein [Longimicrobiales bacterium]
MQWWCAAQGVPWSWRWQAYPGVWLFALALVGLFRLARRRWPETDRPRFRAWMYGLGVAALWVALDWPVGALGAGYLASVHMVQYLLIALVAPPLLLIGLPRGFFRALTAGPLGPVVRVVSHPIAAIGIFVTIMAWTHWPPVVDTLMVTQSGSFLLDFVWLVSGLAFWWPVVAPEPVRRWLHEPGKVGYLIVATLVNTGVFAYLTFSPLPLYATYELAPPVSGLSSRDDQLLAGLLMKMGGAVVLWTAISILFYRWYRRSEADEGVRGAVAGLCLLLALGACGPDAGAAMGDEEPDVGVPGAEAAGEAAGDGWTVHGPLEIRDVRMGAPPVPDRAALYLTVRARDAEVVIAGVEVEGAGRAELHETRMDGDIMRMGPVDRVTVAPGAEVALQPGGLHVMVLDLGERPVAGDRLAVRLLLASPDTVLDVVADVVPLDRVGG